MHPDLRDGAVVLCAGVALQSGPAQPVIHDCADMTPGNVQVMTLCELPLDMQVL